MRTADPNRSGAPTAAAHAHSIIGRGDGPRRDACLHGTGCREWPLRVCCPAFPFLPPPAARLTRATAEQAVGFMCWVPTRARAPPSRPPAHAVAPRAPCSRHAYRHGLGQVWHVLVAAQVRVLVVRQDHDEVGGAPGRRGGACMSCWGWNGARRRRRSGKPTTGSPCGRTPTRTRGTPRLPRVSST